MQPSVRMSTSAEARHGYLSEKLWGLRLAAQGAQLYSQALSETELSILRALADSILVGRSGARLFGGEVADVVLSPAGALRKIAVSILGDRASPVRAVLFDKTAETNWSVGWHQDRTIAVLARHEVEGYGPWSRKHGAIHVEPPFDILRNMITLRAHLDDCDDENAPLLIAVGSHLLGRLPVEQVAGIGERLGTAQCLAQARDVWAYATPIVHGSRRASRPRQRRVLQIDYSVDDLPGGLQWLGIAPETRRPWAYRPIPRTARWRPAARAAIVPSGARVTRRARGRIKG